MNKSIDSINILLHSAKQGTRDGLAVAGKTIEKLTDKRICIGITGLSKSGKTTFITSFINQLLMYEKANLADFSPFVSNRLLGVKIHPLEDSSLAEFPYQSAYRQLTSGEGGWPESTVDISGCKLELRLKRKSRPLNPLLSDSYSLFVEIRDYPGEWLLDLPLREKSFQRWSAQCAAQYIESPRRELLGELLQDLQSLNPLEIADEVKLMTLNVRFKQFLQACKHGEHSLSLIQPGRFLVPGVVKDESLLCFVPLLKLSQYSDHELAAARDDSYFKVCESRYNAYIKELVEPFYRNFFSKIDRQLILVDVISALNSGPNYMEDMRHALVNITDSFAYGKQGRLMQLFNPKIDKLVFVASKVDQVLAKDHESVKQLLGAIIRQIFQNAKYEGLEPVCEAAAAVRTVMEVEQNGRTCLPVVLEGLQVKGYVNPEIPIKMPQGDAVTTGC